MKLHDIGYVPDERVWSEASLSWNLVSAVSLNLIPLYGKNNALGDEIIEPGVANLRLQSPQLVILVHNADIYLFAPSVLQSFCQITLFLVVLTYTSADLVSDEGGNDIIRTRL